MLASDDRAAALYRARGRRDGRTLELDQVLLFRFEDGLVAGRARAPERSGRLRGVLGVGWRAVSEQRFSDGLRYRIEIPSVEGPRVLEAVLDEAERRSVPVRRVSQGSGVMMLTDAEIGDMARLGADAGVEVSLFLGPRGAWDTGGQSLATAAAGGIARGDAGIEAVASPRCAAESRSASARSSSPTSACCRRSGTCGEQESCRRRSS